MESPFPAPGKTIKVKTFLPGAGNEVGISAASSLRSWTEAGVGPASPRLRLQAQAEHGPCLAQHVCTPNPQGLRK